MFSLSLKDSGAFLGTIDDADLQLMVDQLEEEDSDDVDYYVCEDTIALLEENGASAGLLALLRKALGDAEGVDVVWKKA